jgi:hypothetical protein
MHDTGNKQVQSQTTDNWCVVTHARTQKNKAMEFVVLLRLFFFFSFPLYSVDKTAAYEGVAQTVSPYARHAYVSVMKLVDRITHF